MELAARRGVSYLFVALVSASILVMGLGSFLGVFYQRDGVTLSNATADVKVGLDYFKGTLRLKNGGPPCGRVCHRISDIGVSGGDVGPDLSDIMVKVFGGNVTRAVKFLQSPTTPTMRATWAGTPLTDHEISVIVELLKYAAAHDRD
jgi:hypothetical protein